MYFTLLNICMVMFSFIGVDPRKGYTVTQVILFFVNVSSQWNIILLSVLLIVYKEDIIATDVTNMLETAFIMLHGIVKITILYIKRNKVRDLLEGITHFWKIEDVEDEAEREEHFRYMRFIKIVFVLYTLLCIATTLSFTCKGFFIKGESLTFTTYAPPWIPYPIMVVYEAMMFITGIYFPIPGLDKFVLTIMLLTKMQLKMLNQEMRRVFNEAAEEEGNSEKFERKVKKVVEYHDFLLNYVNKINNVFSEGMLVYVIVIVLSMCIQMYIVSTQDSVKTSIKAAVYMTNGVTQYIICYCLPGQAICDEADRTTEYAYFSKWYDNPTKSMKIAQVMIIGRSQKKALILAGGFVKVDLETCLKTIKTMVSYAMFIRTMGIGQN